MTWDSSLKKVLYCHLLVCFAGLQVTRRRKGKGASLVRKDKTGQDQEEQGSCSLGYVRGHECPSLEVVEFAAMFSLDCCLCVKELSDSWGPRGLVIRAGTFTLDG